MCENSSKLTTNTPELLTLSFLLTLRRFMTLFWCFFCWIWTWKCWLGLLHLFLYVQYFIAFLFFSLYFVFFHVCFIPFVEVFHKGNLKKSHLMSHYPEKIYLFKVKNWNIWKRQAICSMLTIKTPERYQWRHFGVYC